MLAATAHGGQPPAAPMLVQEITLAGARAFALGEFCTMQNRNAVKTFATALAGWQQRNRWTVVQSYWASDPDLKQRYDAGVQSALASFRQHGIKSAIACGLMDGVVRQAEWDPSVQHGTEIARMAMAPAAAKPGASEHAASPEAAGPAASATGAPPPARDETGAAAPAPAGERLTSGVGTFAMPAGWAIARSTPEMALLTRQERGNDRTLLVVTSVPMTTDLRSTAFAAFRAQFPGSGLTFRYFRDGSTGTGLPAVYGGDVGKLRTGGSVSVRAVAVQVGDRVETVLMVLPGGALVTIERQKEMEALVGGMTFAGGAGRGAWSPLRPGKGDGGLSGLWMGTRLQNQLNPLGGMDLLAIREYAVLFPDGRVYFGLPAGGKVLTMDYAAACATRPKQCGLYARAGGQIEFEQQADYGLVTRSAVPFHAGEPGRSSFEQAGATLVETQPVHALRVNGNYTATSGMSGTTGTQSASVFSQTYLRFGADGTFEKSGFTTVGFSGSGAAGTTNARRGVERGTYTMDGYTLTLRPAEGAAELYTVVFEEIAASPKAVFVDDRAFLREGR